MCLKTILLSLCLLFSCSIIAQELKCNLTVNSSMVEGTNKQLFTTLESDLGNFVNEYRWTELIFAEHEKIDCNITLIVKSVEDDLFQCEMQVQASRPVYGSAYTTPLFNVRDENVVFHYKEFDKIEINNSTFETNLTAIIAYYAYMIIGFDLDSYSRLGGTAAFSMAEQIVSTCQTRSDDTETRGWKMEFGSKRNRYSLARNLNDDAFKSLREYFYEYHRLGLDNMTTNVDNSRAKIAGKITVLRDLNRQNPSVSLIITFLDSKNDELINIFKNGTSEEKKLVHDVLVSVNPTLSNRYDEIIQ